MAAGSTTGPAVTLSRLLAEHEPVEAEKLRKGLARRAVLLALLAVGAAAGLEHWGDRLWYQVAVGLLPVAALSIAIGLLRPWGPLLRVLVLMGGGAASAIATVVGLRQLHGQDLASWGKFLVGVGAGLAGFIWWVWDTEFELFAPKAWSHQPRRDAALHAVLFALARFVYHERGTWDERAARRVLRVLRHFQVPWYRRHCHVHHLDWSDVDQERLPFETADLAAGYRDSARASGISEPEVSLLNLLAEAASVLEEFTPAQREYFLDLGRALGLDEAELQARARTVVELAVPMPRPEAARILDVPPGSDRKAVEQAYQEALARWAQTPEAERPPLERLAKARRVLLG